MRIIRNMKQAIEGQSLLEYVILVGVVAAAFGGMYIFMNRGVNAKFKILESQVNTAKSDEASSAVVSSSGG